MTGLVDEQEVYEFAREASEIAAAHAAEVDAEGRFPSETISALTQRGLLGIAVRLEEADPQKTATVLGKVTEILARGCSSSGLIYAMHQSQAVTLLRHGGRYVDRYRTRLAEEQLLLASATSEITTKGDVGRSACAVVGDGLSISLRKETPVISYGDEATGFLVTARRSPAAPPHDQVLILCPRSDTSLTRVSQWDSLGMRGTSSHGYVLEHCGADAVVFDDSFQEINTVTHSPMTHFFWSSAWIGVARACLDAALFWLKSQGGDAAISQFRDLRLASLKTDLRVMIQLTRDFAAQMAQPPTALEATLTLQSNTLKLMSSETLANIALGCFRLIGFDAYSDRESKCARLLRDALSAPVMISNDRILLNQSRIARSRIGLL